MHGESACLPIRACPCSRRRRSASGSHGTTRSRPVCAHTTGSRCRAVCPSRSRRHRRPGARWIGEPGLPPPTWRTAASTRGDIAAHKNGVRQAPSAHRSSACPGNALAVRRAHPSRAAGVAAASAHSNCSVPRPAAPAGRRQATASPAGRLIGRGGSVRTFLLPAQAALTFLLADDFLAGIIALAEARRIRKAGHDFRTGLRGHGGIQGAAKQNTPHHGVQRRCVLRNYFLQ